MIAGDAWQLVYILVAGVLATYFWRFLGVFAASGMREDGELFRWVRAVSTALVAALIARLILFPQGGLADVAVAVRAFAFVAGFAVFWFTGRTLIYGIIAGELALVAGILI